MKPGKNCMSECMSELTHKSTTERPQAQKVAICMKQCGTSNQDFEHILNIDTMKRQKYYCQICKRNHYMDTMIGKSHMSAKSTKKESQPQKEFTNKAKAGNEWMKHLYTLGDPKEINKIVYLITQKEMTPEEYKGSNKKAFQEIYENEMKKVHDKEWIMNPNYRKNMLQKETHSKEQTNEELNKQLQQYWKDTAVERKRTHSGKMYDKYMNRGK